MKWNDPHAQQESEKYAFPIPSRQLILQVLAQQETALDFNGFVQIFEMHESDQIIALKRRLAAMVRDFQLALTDDFPEQYRSLGEDDVFIGRVLPHVNGHGFVELEDAPDLFVSDRELCTVFNHDVVKAVVAGSNEKGLLKAKIIEIVKRLQTEFIGRVCLYDEGYFVHPEFPNSHQPIAIELSDLETHELKAGDWAKVRIDEWPSKDEYATGHIKQNLSQNSEFELIIPSTLLDFHLPHEFSVAALKQSEQFAEPTAKDTKGRQDIRDLALVTIDGEDARDFDDAVFAQRQDGEHYRLVVAIADVSHYVTTDSALDQEALERGTSVYFPNHVVPMLPEVLSNGLCSLKPNVDRLCMVCDMILTNQGTLKSYQFYAGVMHSAARLTYGQVEQYLTGMMDAETPVALQSNQAVQQSLTCLNHIYHALLKERHQRSALDFETTETYMVLNDAGEVDQILPRTRLAAHRLIEECMLITNVCAANFTLEKNLPALYRVHDHPDSTRLDKVRDYLKMLAISFPQKPTQKDYQWVMTQIADRPDKATIHTVLLRSMMQAVYSPYNAGHFGLAYDAYLHFTSPIRRYPDLLVHRAIKMQLSGGKQPVEPVQLEAIGQHLSATERRADEASRHVVSWLKCHYMKQHVGEKFEGVITGVAEFGLFVTLSSVFVEGLVHVSHLNDYYTYDAARQCLVGRAKRQTFSLGDRVEVLVAGVSVESRKIDFDLANQAGGRSERRGGGRASHESGSAKGNQKEQGSGAKTRGKSSTKSVKKNPAAPASQPKPPAKHQARRAKKQ